MDDLIGRFLPEVALRASSDRLVLLADQPGTSVVFCYPYTGQPGVADPPGWDDIPGAHGSTPQAEAYGQLYPEFKRRGLEVFGLSLQSTSWQQEFVKRKALPFLLLSDESKLFSSALNLPVFKAGKDDYLKRLTLIIRDGMIMSYHLVTGAPADDAATTLALFGDEV